MMAFTPAIRIATPRPAMPATREDAEPQPPALIGLGRLCVLMQHHGNHARQHQREQAAGQKLGAEVRASSGVGSG